MFLWIKKKKIVFLIFILIYYSGTLEEPNEYVEQMSKRMCVWITKQVNNLAMVNPESKVIAFQPSLALSSTRGRNKISCNFALCNSLKLLIGFFVFHFLNPFVQLQVKYHTTFVGKRTNFTL